MVFVMGVCRRTEAYERLVYENEASFQVLLLRTTLIDLFSHLVVVMVCASTGYFVHRKHLEGHRDLILHHEEEARGLEHEAPMKVNNLLLSQQNTILEELQREQVQMANKIEEFVAARVQKVEDQLLEELRGTRQAIGGRHRSAMPEEATELSNSVDEVSNSTDEVTEQPEERGENDDAISGESL